MIDLSSSNKDRATAATLRLAERRAWREISLLDIAEEAGMPLADLAKDVASKSQLLAGFAGLVDEEVLRKIGGREAGEVARERLFDVIMTRLEVLAPYRAALRQIAGEVTLAPELAQSYAATQGWMLAAAGVPTEGLAGLARRAGLGLVYAQTFRVWLADDDPGLARTMAALDRRLRRGERWLTSADGVLRAGLGLCTSLWAGRRATSEPGTSTTGAASANGSTAGSGPDAPGQRVRIES